MRGVAQQDSRPRSLLGVMKPGAGFDKRLFDPLFKFAGGQGGEFGELDCKLGHTVQIEPGLRPQSPKNGSFPNVRRRLSAISPWECLKWELGDRQLSCKSPPLAGLCADIRDIFSRRRTGWLATQCRSPPPPRKFPANREFYREFCNFRAPRTDSGARNRCAAAISRAIP